MYNLPIRVNTLTTGRNVFPITVDDRSGTLIFCTNKAGIGDQRKIDLLEMICNFPLNCKHSFNGVDPTFGLRHGLRYKYVMVTITADIIVINTATVF